MNYKDDAWMYDAFSRDADLPASFDSRLTGVYDTVRRKSGRGKDKTVKRHMKKSARTALIIAAVIAILTGSVFAVYQISMGDRLLEDEVYMTRQNGDELYRYSAVGTAPEEQTEEQASEEADELLSIMAGDSPEYRALREWFAYRAGYVVLDQRELLGYDDPHRLYGVGYRNLADKLDELAEKYGLRLLAQGYAVTSEEELFDFLGVELFDVGDELGAGETIMLYDDGSLEAWGVEMACDGVGGTLPLQLIRSMKGTLTAFELWGDAPDVYTYESYTTSSGVSTQLALGETSSMIFAETGDCFVTVRVGAGRRAAEKNITLSMDDIKEIVDAIDIKSLDAVDREDFARRVTELGGAQYAASDAAAIPSRALQAIEALEALGDRIISEPPEGFAPYETYVYGAEDGAAAVSIFRSYELLDGKGGVAQPLQCVILEYSRCTEEMYSQTLSNAASYATDCEVNGNEGYYYTDDFVWLCWYDTENQLIFTLGAPMGFDKNELISMAESVTLA